MQNKKLINFRKNLNLTPQEMARKLGVSASYYYKIEEASRNPSFNFLVKCKRNLDINLDDIFFDINWNTIHNCVVFFSICNIKIVIVMTMNKMNETI